MSGFTAASAALEYFIGFPIFGTAYWVLNGILVEFKVLTLDSDLKAYCNWLWFGALVVYIVVGVFWLPRKIKEYNGEMYR